MAEPIFHVKQTTQSESSRKAPAPETSRAGRMLKLIEGSFHLA
jgi:hypothetical protein